MKKVVINTSNCHEFELSYNALTLLNKEGHNPYTLYDLNHREDKLLVELLEKYGSNYCSAKDTDLQIIEIPDDVKYTIEGRIPERIVEKHRIFEDNKYNLADSKRLVVSNNDVGFKLSIPASIEIFKDKYNKEGCYAYVSNYGDTYTKCNNNDSYRYCILTSHDYGDKVNKNDIEGFIDKDDFENIIERDNSILLFLIDEYGINYCEEDDYYLKIITVPRDLDYFIEYYYGYERVIEKYRIWENNEPILVKESF